MLNATLFLLALEIEVNQAFLSSPFTFLALCDLPGTKKNFEKFRIFFQFFLHAGTVEET